MSHHDATPGKMDEGGRAPDVSLEVTRQRAMVADPANRALDDPMLGQHDEAMLVTAADDLYLPRPESCTAAAIFGP